MMDWKRCGPIVAAMLIAATCLSGCTTTGDDSAALGADQVQPVQDSAVASASLPPLAGQDGSVQTADPAGGADATSADATTGANGTTGATAGTADPALAGTTPPTQTASAPGSFVTLNDVGTVPNAPGRNLAGGLTVEKLLGGWTVISGAAQCRLNLTYTAKTGTTRYRASSPGCQIAGLAPVSSWQLSGTQVQLFNEANALIGTLLLSGNRFIGTLAGGEGISMVG